MNSPGALGRDQTTNRRVVELSRATFAQIRELLLGRTGISLNDDKIVMVANRLRKRLHETNQASFEEYYRLLKAGDAGELQHFINLLTTNVTHYFREEHHFDFLADTLVPMWAGNPSQKDIAIWSAGCSTGEEAYSIAMTLLESPAVSQFSRVKVLATDIDTRVLTRAREGYVSGKVQGLSPGRTKRWFKPQLDSSEYSLQVESELRSIVQFNRLNLLEDWPMKRKFHLIFCRNVMIYFTKAKQHELLQRFWNQLHPGGHLFLGHSENIFGSSAALDLVGKTIYRKR